MTNISNYTDYELKEELKRRKEIQESIKPLQKKDIVCSVEIGDDDVECEEVCY